MKHILTVTALCLVALFSTACRMVTGDDYALPRGQTLSSDLVVTGGNAVLEEDSRVMGSLIVVGGTVNAKGHITGDALVTGGSLSFGPSAMVHGVVQKSGGTIGVAEGAHVPDSESFVIGDTIRSLGNLSLLVLLPLVAIVAALLTTRTKGETIQMKPGSSSGDLGPSPSETLVPSGRNTGLGRGVVPAIILMGLGILLLLQEFLRADVRHYAWPGLILVPGLLCYAGMILGGKDAGRLAMPGSILTMLGLVLMYENTFDRFESWAYAWALILPTSVGLGHYIEGAQSNQPALRKRGIREARIGLIIFVFLAAFFELVVNLNGLVPGGWGRIALPTLLIVAGALLLLSRLPGGATPNATMREPTDNAAVMSASAEPDRRNLVAR